MRALESALVAAAASSGLAPASASTPASTLEQGADLWPYGSGGGGSARDEALCPRKLPDLGTDPGTNWGWRAGNGERRGFVNPWPSALLNLWPLNRSEAPEGASGRRGGRALMNGASCRVGPANVLGLGGVRVRSLGHSSTLRSSLARRFASSSTSPYSSKPPFPITSPNPRKSAPAPVPAASLALPSPHQPPAAGRPRARTPPFPFWGLQPKNCCERLPVCLQLGHQDISETIARSNNGDGGKSRNDGNLNLPPGRACTETQK